MLNIATSFNGNVLSVFKPYSKSIMRHFIRTELLPVLPEDFYTHGELSGAGFTKRIVNHTDSYRDSANHFFKGTWKSIPSANDGLNFLLTFEVTGNAVSAVISQAEEGEYYEVNNLKMIGNQLCFTFQTKSGKIQEVKGHINDDQLFIELYGIEDYYGNFTLIRED